MLNELSSLQYGKQINEMLFDSWMDDTDKTMYIALLNTEYGLTMGKINSDIIKGVNNGYSVESQVEVVNEILKGSRSASICT